MRRWFVTGASRGLGRAITEAALAAGDRVVGVARDVTPLDDLVDAADGRLTTFPLDVSERDVVLTGVDRAVAALGGLDVVVNNAGAALLGMVEEIDEQQARAHLDVNFFGALWVTQAVLPVLRGQEHGHLLQVSSMGSSGGFASTGLYGASKAALDAVSEAVAMEVEDLGVRVTILNPGGYETGLFTAGLTEAAPLPAYDGLRARLAQLWSESVDADPALAAEVIIRVVDMADPPKRIILGGAAFDVVRDIERARAEEVARWEELSRLGDRPVVHTEEAGR